MTVSRPPRSSSTGYRVKLKASPPRVVCSHMGAATDVHRPLVTAQRNPACSDGAPLLRQGEKKKKEKRAEIPEVKVDASRFVREGGL